MFAKRWTYIPTFSDFDYTTVKAKIKNKAKIRNNTSARIVIYAKE